MTTEREQHRLTGTAGVMHCKTCGGEVRIDERHDCPGLGALAPNYPEFGDAYILNRLRAVIQDWEKLPGSPQQTNVVTRLSDAAFAIQQLQKTGTHNWPVHYTTEQVADRDLLNDLCSIVGVLDRSRPRLVEVVKALTVAGIRKTEIKVPDLLWEPDDRWPESERHLMAKSPLGIVYRVFEAWHGKSGAFKWVGFDGFCEDKPAAIASCQAAHEDALLVAMGIRKASE